MSCSSKAERVADLRVGARAEAAGLLVADVDGDVGDAELQRLEVGVDGHELDPGIRASTIRLTALTPAPPTPTTRITGWCGWPLPSGSYSGSSRP